MPGLEAGSRHRARGGSDEQEVGRVTGNSLRSRGVEQGLPAGPR